MHNQHLERLHQDINTQVVNQFYNKFSDLEDSELLDLMNDTDLFYLHEVFLDRINLSLNQFVAVHNNHGLSTEQNQMPLQLFRLNLCLLQFQNLDPTGLLDLEN